MLSKVKIGVLGRVNKLRANVNSLLSKSSSRQL